MLFAEAANARYLRSDFNEMIRKITIIQILIDAQVPTIADLFEEYKEALVATVIQINEVRYFSTICLTFFLTGIHQSAQKANYWALEIFHRCSIDYNNAFRKNVDTCVFTFSFCLTVSYLLNSAARHASPTSGMNFRIFDTSNPRS